MLGLRWLKSLPAYADKLDYKRAYCIDAGLALRLTARYDGKKHYG